MNLAVNARDAMPNGGKLIIETSNIELDEEYARKHPGTLAGPHAMLAVSDNGIGMDEKTAERIFEPFFTTKEQGKGTGLGLSTVYGIIKQSGGNIWVYSEPGCGTTFKIYLPLATGVASPGEKSSNSALRAVSQGHETILLVEDEAGVRELITEVLSTVGYHVLSATDGQDALKVSAGHGDQIQLMITDVIMPSMSGRELADRLRIERPEMRVLFISGYTSDAIGRHGVLDENIAFLEKPFTPASIARKVRELLDSD
jgi:CheY-like chemotaxis protein